MRGIWRGWVFSRWLYRPWLVSPIAGAWKPCGLPIGSQPQPADCWYFELPLLIYRCQIHSIPSVERLSVVKTPISPLAGWPRGWCPENLDIDACNASIHGLPAIFRLCLFHLNAKKGQPLFGCSIIKQVADPAKLELASFNLQRDLYVSPNKNPHEEAGVYTLNYLGQNQGKQQWFATKFDWSWIGKYGVDQFDDVLSFNRQTFATWFDQVLKSLVPPNCVSCRTSCWRTEPRLSPHRFRLQYYVRWPSGKSRNREGEAPAVAAFWNFVFYCWYSLISYCPVPPASCIIYLEWWPSWQNWCSEVRDYKIVWRKSNH